MPRRGCSYTLVMLSGTRRANHWFPRRGHPRRELKIMRPLRSTCSYLRLLPRLYHQLLHPHLQQFPSPYVHLLLHLLLCRHLRPCPRLTLHLRRRCPPPPRPTYDRIVRELGFEREDAVPTIHRRNQSDHITTHRSHSNFDGPDKILPLRIFRVPIKMLTDTLDKGSFSRNHL